MADSKNPYSTTSNYYVTIVVPNVLADAARFNRSKNREKKHNSRWELQKVNINDIVDKFAPGSAGRIDGVKFVFEGPKYSVIADMASGYLRIRDNASGKFLKLDGSPGSLDETHFKIKKKEEM